MPATAYLFPGQGSQFVGMGRDLLDRFEPASDVFDAADAVLGFRLTDIMFGNGGDPEEEARTLRQTENTQPALFVHSMAVFEVLSGFGLEPDITAGHSLGEYTALAAARAISFEQGLQIVRLRGEVMARAGKERPGSMAAILGLEDGVIDRICREVSGEGLGVVTPANYNAPGQVVICGGGSATAAKGCRSTQSGFPLCERCLSLSPDGAGQGAARIGTGEP